MDSHAYLRIGGFLPMDEGNVLVTGWHLDLMQDECKGLGKWFASRLDARHTVRKVFMKQLNATQIHEALKRIVKDADIGTLEGWTVVLLVRQDMKVSMHTVSIGDGDEVGLETK